MSRFVPRAFVSYSWESKEHRDWVKALSKRLRGDGVDVTLDEWHLRPASAIPRFMESAVRDNDFVLIVCTEVYRGKADNRTGGVGPENDLMTGELLEKGNREKFIPILRSGNWIDSRPAWLAGSFYLDFRGTPYDEANYQHLLDALFHLLPSAPPLGSRLPLQGVELDYQNGGSGVSVRVLNALPRPGTFRLILRSLDSIHGHHLTAHREMSLPLSTTEPIGAQGKGQWRPLAFVTKKDFSEFKIESNDERTPSIFVREPGVWRLRIEVFAEEFGRDVFELWLRWNPGRSPEASDVPIPLQNQA